MNLILPKDWSFKLEVDDQNCHFMFVNQKSNLPWSFSSTTTRHCFNVVGFWQLLDIGFQQFQNYLEKINGN